MCQLPNAEMGLLLLMEKDPTYRAVIGCGKLYMTVFVDSPNEYPSVILRLGKAGTCANAQIQSMAQLINLSLSLGATFKQIKDSLKDIGCIVPTKDGKSCGDGVGKLLKRHINYLKEKK